MFVEEFSLDAVGVFEPPAFNGSAAPPLPPAGNLLGAGASLFLASDLFPACQVRNAERRAHQGLTVLPGMPGAFYSGDGLDQFDLDVFLGCVLKDIRKDKTAPRSMREFLRDIGRRATPSYMARLEGSLLRLAKARVELDDRRFSCCVQLLESVLVDRKLGVCRVKASPEAVEALDRPGGLESLARFRFGLGQRPLTKWLAGLLWILEGEACLLDVEKLRLLCGRHTTDPLVFAGQVMPALGTLVDSGYIASVRQWMNGTLMVSRNPGRNCATGCQLVW